MEEDFSNLPKSRKDALEKGFDFYFTNKRCKLGHLNKRHSGNGDCVTYRAITRKERYNKESPEDRRKKQRVSYSNNRERINKNKRRWNKNNKDKVQGHRENMKPKRNAQRRLRYKEDLEYRLNNQLRNMLRRSVDAAKSEKTNTTSEMMGYSSSEMRECIEAKFIGGMSWDNYGEWHIDHVYPVSRFVEDGIQDPRIINSLDNLVPMWAEHNIKKDNMTLSEFLEYDETMKDLYEHFLTGQEV